jgi:tRNA pseudouridine55 synthase
MQLKRLKRPVSGVLLLDKPAGPSSNQVLQQAKRLYSAAKAGHTGSLDPIATGLLPVCFGEATKFSHYLLESDETYIASIRLGITTTTADSEGKVVHRSKVSVLPGRVEQVLAGFCGKVSQMPPMYSALKYQGKAFYEYARAGIEIERTCRDVTVYSIELNEFADEILEITVACSKGTYIRTLSEDIGAALGCGGHLVGLRRVASGNFAISSAYSLERLEQMSLEQRDACLLPVDCLMTSLASIKFDEECVCRLRKGQPVQNPESVSEGMLRLYGPNGWFFGVGEVMEGGWIAPRRLLA